LTIDELKDVFEYFKIDFDAEKILEVFNLLDLNGNGVLTLDEF
jgi:Ca2+-binding EF-hand superfamily protein